MKKITSIVLIIALVLALAVPALAAEGGFSDVSGHWAETTIDDMAEGGLVHGYEDGTFRPNGTISIAEMATIIANAKGHGESNQAGYWAYGALDYCITELKCLPSQGEISPANYGVPCERQLAIYMLYTGLGYKDGEYRAITGPQIPDFAQVASAYKEAVLRGYQQSILIGKDTEGTFGPYDTLTRAEMATIFFRAGWREAGATVTAGTAPTNAEIIAAIQQLPSVTWTKKELSDRVIYTTNELVYGGIEMGFRTDMEGCWIDLYERRDKYIYDANGNQIDINGNVIEWWHPLYHATTDPATDPYHFWPSGSAYRYEARQLVKQILSICYPTKGAAAYDALMNVFNGRVYETSAMTPSVLRWYDGRMLHISHTAETHLVSISIDPVGDTEMYDRYLAKPVSTVHNDLMTWSGVSEYYGWMYRFDTP